MNNQDINGYRLDPSRERIDCGIAGTCLIKCPDCGTFYDARHIHSCKSVFSTYPQKLNKEEIEQLRESLRKIAKLPDTG